MLCHENTTKVQTKVNQLAEKAESVKSKRREAEQKQQKQK